MQGYRCSRKSPPKESGTWKKSVTNVLELKSLNCNGKYSESGFPRLKRTRTGFFKVGKNSDRIKRTQSECFPISKNSGWVYLAWKRGFAVPKELG